ncbi:MAG: ABC transporter permease [Treponema sp.]|nr:ABC transporter permease [Treponema sp.]
MLSFELFLQTSVQMGTHILIAILGGILCEKVGNTNLGIEGMMLMGAAIGFKMALITASPVIAFLTSGLAGMFGAMIYALITVTLRGNQVVTGLVLTIFGGGVSGYIGKSLAGKSLPEAVSNFFAPKTIPLLHKIPIVGKMFFDQSIYVYFGIICAILLFLYFKYTQWGLNTRAVGENPAAADASGINVTLYKYIHISLGGFLCGIAGAYLSLVFVPRWQENITAGAGWIAVALVIFSTWNPLKAIFAAYVFGALKGIGFKFQNVNWIWFGKKVVFSPHLLDMIPYIATILVLVLMTFRKKKEYQSPAGLSIPYFREER